MAKDWAGSPDMKVLVSGTIVVESDAKPGTFVPWKCGWLVQVPSGNPEPDSPSDCWKVIDCGAKVHDHPRHPGRGWECEVGHDHVDIEIAWIEEREAEERAEREGPTSRFATW